MINKSIVADYWKAWSPKQPVKMDVWWFPTISYVKVGNHPIETTIYKMVVWGSRGVSHSLHKTFNHHKSASGAKLERHDNCSLPAQHVQQNGFTSGFTVSLMSSEQRFPD